MNPVGRYSDSYQNCAQIYLRSVDRVWLQNFLSNIVISYKVLGLGFQFVGMKK